MTGAGPGSRMGSYIDADADHGTAEDARRGAAGEDRERTAGGPGRSAGDDRERAASGAGRMTTGGDGRGGDGRVAAVRAFNRFYTPVIGLLREGLYGSPYSLTEVRVIYELAQRDGCETTELRNALGLDAGYLSRILARFGTEGLIIKERSKADGRRQVVRLTGVGRELFAAMEASSNQQVQELLAPIAEAAQRRLLAAMNTIQHVLTARTRPRAAAVTLRPPRPGDLGWVIGRNGAVYAEQYGWDETYEALVARIVADYAAGHDPVREAAWIAEADGRRAGCIFCVRKDGTTAKLRLLLVEPWARGMGIGGHLVAECVDFAKRNGYREMVLWTQSMLTDARRIYQRAGFELIESEPHHSFGRDLVGETWRLALT